MVALGQTRFPSTDSFQRNRNLAGSDLLNWFKLAIAVVGLPDRNIAAARFVHVKVFLLSAPKPTSEVLTRALTAPSPLGDFSVGGRFPAREINASDEKQAAVP